ncbi:hypothetical protein GCM10010211_71630 [Streptomyces albospinus]|uniref:Secreted protein n=1 Tax=Streptomyces albospinus TaxID=285515 RepID=A0ABQ2VNT6_9ACTN|nr:hypothetical protein GCM10010211_71630 [Streptomyces albospinus]
MAAVVLVTRTPSSAEAGAEVTPMNPRLAARTDAAATILRGVFTVLLQIRAVGGVAHRRRIGMRGRCVGRVMTVRRFNMPSPVAG